MHKQVIKKNPLKNSLLRLLNGFNQILKIFLFPIRYITIQEIITIIKLYSIVISYFVLSPTSRFNANADLGTKLIF